MIAPLSTRAHLINDQAASFTVDVEQDCPPYLSTCRGMTEGMARLLDMLAERGLRAPLSECRAATGK
jgi:hypothetical protein